MPDNVQPSEGCGPHPKDNEKANAHSQSPPSPASSVGGLGFVKVLVHDPLGVDGAGFENPQDTQNLLSDTRERDQTNLLDAAVRNISVSLDTNSPATADNTTGSPNQSPQEHQDETSNEVVPATPTKEQRERAKKKEKKKRQNLKHLCFVFLLVGCGRNPTSSFKVDLGVLIGILVT